LITVTIIGTREGIYKRAKRRKRWDQTHSFTAHLTPQLPLISCLFLRACSNHFDIVGPQLKSEAVNSSSPGIPQRGPLLHWGEYYSTGVYPVKFTIVTAKRILLSSRRSLRLCVS
jgi:hypothetical protein